MVRPSRFLLLLAALTCATVSRSQAYENIATVNTTTTLGTASTSEGLNYSNNVVSLTGFASASGAAYSVASSADYAYTQRNGTPNNSSVWYVSNSGGFAGSHQSSYAPLLKTNNFLQGSDNTFANVAVGANPNPAVTGNIERLDFTWGKAFNTDLNAIAFAVFDRGDATVHDSFTIAIVTGIYTVATADATHPVGTPSIYGGFLKIAAGWGAATNPVANQNYNLFRYSNGNDLSASNLHNETNAQGVGGLVIRASEFGLTAGTPVYGYSLMAEDVDPSTANDLLDVTKTGVFPATTNDTTGAGGIDLAAVNGLEIHLVPEPSTWALFVAGGILLSVFGLRRERQRTV